MHENPLLRLPSCLCVLFLLLIFSNPALAQETAEGTPLSWISVLPPLLPIVLAAE